MFIQSRLGQEIGLDVFDRCGKPANRPQVQIPFLTLIPAQKNNMQSRN